MNRSLPDTDHEHLSYSYYHHHHYRLGAVAAIQQYPLHRGADIANRSLARPGVELMSNVQVQVYDTTLRDGTQREGISLSVSDKLKITRILDELGIAYIKG